MFLNQQDPKIRALTQAHILHQTFQSHTDGLIDLRKDSDARTAIQEVTRMDADTGGMLRSLLTYYSPKVIFAEYRQIPYADPAGFVSRSNDGSLVGVAEIVKTIKGRIGKWASTGETTRINGRIDINQSEIIYGSEYKMAWIGYTSQELDRAYFASQSSAKFGMMIDIVADKMTAAAASYQEFLNDVMASGLPSRAIFGLHTHPNVVRIRAPYRPGALRTPEENLALFNLAISVMNSISANRYAPDLVIGPRAILNELSIQRVGASSDLSTLKYLNLNSSIKGYIPTSEAETASRSGGAILHFLLRDEDTEGLVTKAMTQLSMPQYRNGEYQVYWDAAVSGVHLDRPVKHVILELP
jgi:hypothetical protein